MKNKKSIKATHFRPSSLRSVSVRNIGAAHTLYPAISRTETLRDDASGMTALFNNGGFTLIELLVVVLIIGILAAVAVPQYRKAVGKSRTMQAVVAMKALSDAQEVYYLAKGTYTAQLDELDVNVPLTNEYFSYSCATGYQSCLAIPQQEGLPVLEFALQQNSYHPGGVKWCQVDEIPMSESAKKQALDICRSLGPRDETITKWEFHLIQ